MKIDHPLGDREPQPQSAKPARNTAALLEGIGRQTILVDGQRYMIGALMLLGWLIYFYWPRSDDGAAA